MKACEAAEEKKRRREEEKEDNAKILWRQFQWCSSKVQHDLHTAHRTAAPTSTVLGQPPTVPVATVVHLYPFYTTAAGGSQATTVVHSS
jgi:hypothetical protein